MTREEILVKWDGMAPRERDSLIAEKVMGWTMQTKGRTPVWYADERPKKVVGEWHPSTEISAAFEVVEEMDSTEWDMKLIKSGQYCEVSFGMNTVVRTTVPEAICKAALLTTLEAS